MEQTHEKALIPAEHFRMFHFIRLVVIIAFVIAHIDSFLMCVTYAIVLRMPVSLCECRMKI